MNGGLNIPSFAVPSPQVVTGTGAPDPLQTFLATFLKGTDLGMQQQQIDVENARVQQQQMEAAQELAANQQVGAALRAEITRAAIPQLPTTLGAGVFLEPKLRDNEMTRLAATIADAPDETVPFIVDAWQKLQPKKPGTKVVGKTLVNEETGQPIFQEKDVPNLPADLQAAAWEAGILDVNEADPRIRTALMKRYVELKKAGSTNINLNTQGQRDFANINDLGRAFLSEIAEHRIVANNYSTVSAAAQDPSAAGDLALIFAYMKMLDPGSAVRDTEYANAQNAAGVPERIRATFNRVKDGEKLGPDQRKDFVARAEIIATQRQKQLKPVIQRYQRRAGTVGLDPSLIVYDPFAEAGLGAPKPKYSPNNPYAGKNWDQ